MDVFEARGDRLDCSFRPAGERERTELITRFPGLPFIGDVPERLLHFGIVDRAVPELFVAVQQSTQETVGAAALGFAVRGMDPSRVRCAIEVHHGFRRRKVGTRLLELVMSHVANAGVRVLEAWAPTREPEEFAFLRAVGCHEVWHSDTFELELEGVLSAFVRTLERLKRRNKLPRDVEVISACEGPVDDIARLVSNELLQERGWPEMSARIRGQVQRSFAPHLSVALIRGRELLGALLAEQDGDCVDVFARVVVPRCRESWAHVALTAAACERGKVVGVRRIRCIADSRNRASDTSRLAFRAGAICTRSLGQFVLPVPEIVAPLR
jgi:GNAT superfamily N-acetyltransferase